MRYARLSISLLLLFALALATAACGGDDDGGGSIILATTTSTENSGLLDELLPLFSEETDIEVRPIAVGTGAALEMARDGNADVVLVHAPEAEQEYIDSGDLVEGEFVMHNDFVLVGPPGDPAGLAGATTLAEAMAAIATNGDFTSRGDDSGTHKKELELWEIAGTDPATITNYEETGQGMGATLNVADQRGGYTLTDRATYLALSGDLELEILFEGAPEFLNLYHVYLVNPEQHDGIQAAPGRQLIQFFVSDDAQALIGTFGVEEFGQPLFFPDAGKTVGDVLAGG